MLGYINKKIEEWKEKKRLQEEERAEKERIRMENKRAMLEEEFNEKMERIQNILERLEDREKECREGLKKLIRKYGKNAEGVVDRAYACLKTEKIRERFELFAVAFDTLKENVDLILESMSAIEDFKELAKVLDEIDIPENMEKLPEIGLKMSMMEKFIARLTKRLTVQTRVHGEKIPSKEVKALIDKLSAEVKAEEEEELREAEVEKRIEKLSQASVEEG